MILDWNSWNLLNENLTEKQLDLIEDYADKLFRELDMDVDFTKHFRERVNDTRNDKHPITSAELIGFFKRSFIKTGKKIAKLPDSAQAVLHDMRTDFNVPFVIVHYEQSQDLVLKLKTIMRKKDFKSKTPIIDL